MSTVNFGNVISKEFGVLITYYLGITNHNFTSLWILILITNFASILPMPFIGAVSEEDV
jgi:hypothetical protein